MAQCLTSHLKRIQNPRGQNIPVVHFVVSTELFYIILNLKILSPPFLQKVGKVWFEKSNLKKENNSVFRVHLLKVMSDVAHEDHPSE